ncbi:MAG: UTP--glucose-1-phosphate uridylyltransferase [Chloroflexi bacterium RBG_13_54_9]|nr:MAG: UTP--glucose-1-phosphate uridylyltransferase [Chloroflexi bacterium RBG_13_54_9]
MRIRKAVVTAAGWGTRFLPATKAQPKEMLPLVDKPIIQYVIEEAVASGIDQVIIITALGKRAIEDHFDRSFELELALEKKGDKRLLEQVRLTSDLCNISYVRQKEQLGLGHAVLTARYLVGDEPFVLLLPDDIIYSQIPATKQMLDIYDRYQCSVIAVEQVAKEAIPSYGIVETKPVADHLYQVLSLVEKPKPEEALSNLGIVGRYILTPQIFDALEKTSPGTNQEIQLTDALALLLKECPIYAYEFEGKRYDAGTPLGLLKAGIELALHRHDIGEELRKYLRELDIK